MSTVAIALLVGSAAIVAGEMQLGRSGEVTPPSVYNSDALRLIKDTLNASLSGADRGVSTFQTTEDQLECSSTPYCEDLIDRAGSAADQQYDWCCCQARGDTVFDLCTPDAWCSVSGMEQQLGRRIPSGVTLACGSATLQISIALMTTLASLAAYLSL